MAEEHRLRTNRVQIWLVEEEKQLLIKAAYEHGLSQSEYLRQLIVCGAVVGNQWVMEREQGKELIYELNKIGNNLNQITYNTNVKMLATSEDWEEVKENYFSCLDLLKKILFSEKGEQKEWQQQISMLLRKQLENP